MEADNTGLFDVKESVKLVKNTKGYNWEVKLKEDLIDAKTIERLELINKHLEALYGSQGN